MVDLHIHSRASDGTFSPSELVRYAKNLGLEAIALTDHDTLMGLKEAYKEAENIGLPFVCGIEISIKYEREGHFHLLGYFLKPEVPEIEETLKKLHEAREKRNLKMIEKLKELGINISYEELKREGNVEIGRPHVARVLVEKGYVSDVKEAFEKYLKKGAPAYVPKSLLSPEEGISVIRKAKGIPVLAHPVTLKMDREEFEEYLLILKEMGLMGIECYYSEHDKSFTEFLIGLAQKFDLLITGGSDFHGENKPHIKLGVGYGDLKIPFECYQNLVSALSKID